MKMLIVEDDPASRRLMHAYLSPLGKCDLASDGPEAINLVTAAIDHSDIYDLICLDIMMPEMTGHEVLRTIRSMEEEREVFPPSKVIMTTALKDRDNVMAAFTNQCEAYLMKPISRENLFEKLRTLGIDA